jgi:hypothetical protein
VLSHAPRQASVIYGAIAPSWNDPSEVKRDDSMSMWGYGFIVKLAEKNEKTKEA